MVGTLVQADVITGVSIHSFSSQYATDNRLAVDIVNGSGLIDGTYHNTVASDMWFTDGTVETTPTGFVVMDLGTNHALNNIHVWNYNESPTDPQAGFGAKNVEIWVSPDDDVSNLVRLDNAGGDFVFPMATGVNDAGFDVNLSAVTNFELLDDVRLVKFQILDSWRDEVGFPNVNYVGLSEVQFVDNTTRLPLLIVDRDTGKITMTNVGMGLFRIQGYSIQSNAGSLNQVGWTTVTDHYDNATGPGDGSVDADDDWVVLSDSESHTLLGEFQLLPLGDGGAIAPGQTVDLSVSGGAWLKSEIEDLVFKAADPTGSTKEYPVQFVNGPNNAPYERSDLDFDGSINGADWQIFVDGFLGDMTGMSPTQAYQMGDLNRDGRSDLADFFAFEQDYDAANGEGAFAAMLQSVPEPSSTIVAGLVALVAMSCRSPARRVVAR